jgi:hypothetical protein
VTNLVVFNCNLTLADVNFIRTLTFTPCEDAIERILKLLDYLKRHCLDF